MNERCTQDPLKNKKLMTEEEVKSICGAAMLSFDETVMESLRIIGEMMEEVVTSELCGAEDTCPLFQTFGELREDAITTAFTREEMLSGVREKREPYAVVPRVIG